MTALNIIFKSNEAHLFTDGAITDRTGKLGALHEKTIFYPSFPAAFAVLGNSLLLTTIGGHLRLAGIASFDQMLGVIEGIVKIANENLAGVIRQNNLTTDFELHMVGWSEQRSCIEAYLIPGHEMQVAGLVDTRLHRLNKIVDPFGCINPMPSPEAIEAVGWKMPRSSMAFTEADGLKLMEAQRRTVFPQIAFEGSPSFCGIGGFCQHTVITRRSVCSSVIHRWPDNIGEKIVP